MQTTLTNEVKVELCVKRGGEKKSLFFKVKLWDDPQVAWIISPMKGQRRLILIFCYPSFIITLCAKVSRKWRGIKQKQIKLIKGACVATYPPLQRANAPQTSLAVLKGVIVILPGYERRSKLAIVHCLLTWGGILKIWAPCLAGFHFSCPFFFLSCEAPENHSEQREERSLDEKKKENINVFSNKALMAFWSIDLNFHDANRWWILVVLQKKETCLKVKLFSSAIKNLAFNKDKIKTFMELIRTILSLAETVVLVWSKAYRYHPCRSFNRCFFLGKCCTTFCIYLLRNDKIQYF